MTSRHVPRGMDVVVGIAYRRASRLRSIHDKADPSAQYHPPPDISSRRFRHDRTHRIPHRRPRDEARDRFALGLVRRPRRRSGFAAMLLGAMLTGMGLALKSLIR